ncbi:MAG: nuclear transport factor 2 family protein [Bacteroidia bacterium]|nr:nuclear transport factor 2 family protein [Bacteroidia bacterium]
MQKREEIIREYVNAYNRFDTEGMLRHMDENILFTNISGGITDLELRGREAFREQALKAAGIFSERSQEILSMEHHPDHSEVQIAYRGVLAADLPNGMKKGDEMLLQGRSVFRFSGDSITALTDIS